MVAIVKPLCLNQHYSKFKVYKYSQKYECKKYFYYTSTKPRKFDLHKLSIKLTRISILHTEYGYPPLAAAAKREKANFIIRFQKYIKMQMMVVVVHWME